MSRITAKQVTQEALSILARWIEGLTTTELSQKLRDHFRPSGLDKKPLKKGADDAFFANRQKLSFPRSFKCSEGRRSFKYSERH